MKTQIIIFAVLVLALAGCSKPEDVSVRNKETVSDDKANSTAPAQPPQVAKKRSKLDEEMQREIEAGKQRGMSRWGAK